MLNLFLGVDALIVLLLLALAIAVLSHGGYKQRLNVLLAVFCVLVGVWTIANHVGNNLMTPQDIAVIANYFVFSCSFSAMILVTLFVVYLTANKTLMKIAKIALPFMAIIAILAATPLVGAGVERQDGIYGVIFGPLLPLYGIALIAMVIFTFVALRIGLRHTRGLRNNQLQVVGASLTLSLPLVVSIGFILPSATGAFWLTEFGIMPLIILVIGLYYSVIRHKLFDIRSVVVRSVAYVCILGTLSLVYYGLAYIVSILLIGGHAVDALSVSPINILLALFLTIIFQPIKQFFDRITDKVFYRETYKSVEFIARLNRLLGSTTELRGMLERVSDEIATTLKSEQVSFFLYRSKNSEYHMSAGTKQYARLSLYDIKLLDTFTDATKDSVILADVLEKKDKVRRMLVSHRIAVVVPLRSADGIIGYVLLGDHKSGSYTRRDLDVLSTVSDELVIAIQNALSLHEIKELNATLQQRIDAATKELRSSNAQLKHLDEVKDEFMSMASHQLRTPLTSVKGYVSMVLDGDAGDITPQQRKLLGEAFNSSERMVRLIADFLNVSRLQTGRFTLEKQSVDLQEIVRHEVDNLKLIAKSHDISLKTDIMRGPLVLRIDPSKVQQVIMNLVDNAVYYSPAHSTVMISLERVDDRYVEFTVIDQGIGVPVSEQAKLFTRFFRAKNARKQRPDGTGVGLYLAKKVVAAHSGTMIFHSEEGKGSTFGFRLPLSRLDKDTDDTNDKNDHQ